jgi:hypothetical protein
MQTESFTTLPSTSCASQRVAVLYEAAGGGAIYEVASEIAAFAWDAGASVRVRRFGVPGDVRDEDADVPIAERDDIEWASVTFLLARPAIHLGSYTSDARDGSVSF